MQSKGKMTYLLPEWYYKLARMVNFRGPYYTIALESP